jgi:D-beta-D-heptose 7-phosphate kinase/D-beta-D-heptose 1-phosphate adenosyltransferase
MTDSSQASLQSFSNAKVLVVGDVMLDQYWTGKAGRISPEAPVPVVKVANEEMRAGGAANVALNVASLGAQACLLGVVGKNSQDQLDEHGHLLDDLMQEHNVATDWVKSDSGTICKLRVLSHHQQLIRMDFEKPVPEVAAKQLAGLVEKHIADFDILVISDYAKGALQFIEQMIFHANRVNVPVIVDPKGLDFSRYRNATLIKPNQSEFEAIVGVSNSEDELIEKANSLAEELNLQGLLVTRSENGMALVTDNTKPYLLQSKAQEVFDVTGAGDTVVATLATAYAGGLSWQSSVHLANQAASVVVRKVGTSTVTKAELDDEIKADLRHQGYVAPNENELLELVKLAQKNGEKVVFTNGCFDLLHSGHVRYLNEAAKLGDRLVIAVNSDESVKILKGESRPVVALEGRMELLSALSCVDWVVAFNEETPERLICKLTPDILVKGGDYKPEEIVGAQCVWDAGGEVEVLSFWDGYSTTRMVDKIQAEDNS